MPTCFVIQPFDGGAFDDRYDEVFDPAIRAAGLDPYRVDRDPNVTIPIEDIEAGIQAASVCLADITLDNPNVWFELGYAIAAKKDVVIVCADVRQKFPFDIQHRSIIKYSTNSPGDFDKLSEKITARIKAVLQTREKLGHIAEFQSVATVQGLDQMEMSALVSVAEQVDDPDGGTPIYTVRAAMENAGFQNIATTLGLKSLLMKGMLSRKIVSDYNGNEFTEFSVTDHGMQWLFDNKDKLTLRRDGRPAYGDDDEPYTPAGPPASDDIPF